MLYHTKRSPGSTIITITIFDWESYGIFQVSSAHVEEFNNIHNDMMLLIKSPKISDKILSLSQYAFLLENRIYAPDVKPSPSTITKKDEER